MPKRATGLTQGSEVCMLASVLERGFASVCNEIELCLGLADRIEADRLDEIDLTKVVRDMRAWHEDVERTWHELRLLAGDRVGQVSALQRLTNGGLGDEGSLRLLAAVESWQETGGIDASQVREGARMLRERLERERPSE